MSQGRRQISTKKSISLNGMEIHKQWDVNTIMTYLPGSYCHSAQSEDGVLTGSPVCPLSPVLPGMPGLPWKHTVSVPSVSHSCNSKEKKLHEKSLTGSNNSGLCQYKVIGHFVLIMSIHRVLCLKLGKHHFFNLL